MRTVRWRFKPAMVSCCGSTVTWGEAVDVGDADGIIGAADTLAVAPVSAPSYPASNSASTMAQMDLIKAYSTDRFRRRSLGSLFCERTMMTRPTCIQHWQAIQGADDSCYPGSVDRYETGLYTRMTAGVKAKRASKNTRGKATP